MRDIKFGRPLIGEEEKKAVLEVLNGDILVHGPKAKEFEESFAEFTGASSAVSTSSCTAALHLCHFYFETKTGDEVIVPAMTHNATAHSVELTGAKAVFVDAEPETGNINISKIEEKISARTVGISVVHYLGMPVAMDQVMKIARKHNLYVVEDCALSPGAYYLNKHTGLHGDAGCFSFYPVKHMTTGEGGMIITNRDEMAAKLSRQKAFGVNRNAYERSIPGIYDVNMLGFNYRMSEIHAAIGIEQLKKIHDFISKRKENYDRLTVGLKEIDEIRLFQTTNGDFRSNYYCHQILLKDELIKKRFEIVSMLKENGVGTSVYYPEAVPMFTYYREKYNYKSGMYPVAEMISKSSISLPVGPHLNLDDMDYIKENLKKAIIKVK